MYVRVLQDVDESCNFIWTKGKEYGVSQRDDSTVYFVVNDMGTQIPFTFADLISGRLVFEPKLFETKPRVLLPNFL